MFMNETGPLATPRVDCTIDPAGRKNSYVIPCRRPLMNDRNILRVFHDALDRVGHVQDKHAASCLSAFRRLQGRRVGMNSRANITFVISL